MVGINSQINTGDTEDATDLNKVNVLVCTAAKFDSLTRNRPFLSSIATKLRAILLDEVHSIGEPRGAITEALLARLSMAGGNARIIGVSATIGNQEDIVSWFSKVTNSRSTSFHRFDDKNRAVPLRRHTLPFPTQKMNAYQFENSLNTHLPRIIDKYSAGLPTLVFCSTRKSAEACAVHLSRSRSTQKERADIFTDSKLNDLVSKGIAYHHAGLKFEDRRAIEFEFTSGKIKILCATSTLAVGVNLPAHLVIIKGTKQYVETGYQEYSQMDIQQMMGRAGRPQFDKFGVAVILTSEDQKALYERQPKFPIIESQ